METPFARRLQKNLRHLRRWRKNHGIHCFRAYDRDTPEYACTVDVYEEWVHVQEWALPSGVDEERIAVRRAEARRDVGQILEVSEDHVFVKTRQRQKGSQQYQRLAQRNVEHPVREGPARFLVNLSDYLDVGLFLDHRTTRDLVREAAAGRRFLNLFCYTGAVTVHAALGGATSTTSVDLSRTYLQWARRNLALNGLRGGPHELVAADCLEWLRDACGVYDLIFLDPPTFSNSKRMVRAFDVQKDHVELIRGCLRLLAEDGVLYFSNNHRQFRLDRDSLGDLDIRDITRATLPKDFERNPKVHQCFKIRRRASP